jgi:hypothetical protein
MKVLIGVLAIIGALTIAALASGYADRNKAEFERTNDCHFVPSTGMYRCDRSR